VRSIKDRGSFSGNLERYLQFFVDVGVDVVVVVFDDFAEFAVDEEAAAGDVGGAGIDPVIGDHGFGVEVAYIDDVGVLFDPVFDVVVVVLVAVDQEGDLCVPKFGDGIGEEEFAAGGLVVDREAELDVAQPGGDEDDPVRVEEGVPDEVRKLVRR